MSHAYGGGPRLDVVGAINRRDTCVIQVDLADVDFIDSSAIGALVSGYKSAQANGTTFTITGAHGDVRKVLDIAGVLTMRSNGPVVDGND